MTMMTMLSPENLKAAHSAIAPSLHRTPVLSSRRLNQMAGARLYFKCENFQKTGSFKARGALNAVRLLTPQERKAGLITHSSGNHGQALAWAALQEKLSCTVVMPKNAPAAKAAAVKEYGGQVVFCEATLAAREASMKTLQEKTGALFIPPYDHEAIIAGQSSCAAELLEDFPRLHSLIAPVGGGGLLAGSALTAHYGYPQLNVYGAEPQGADDAYRSFHSGEHVRELQANTIADGLRTTLGERNFPIIRQYVSDILRCSEEQIRAALKLIYQNLKIVVEPSSAAALAALLAQPKRFAGREVGLIISGGNLDLARLGELFAES